MLSKEDKSRFLVAISMLCTGMHSINALLGSDSQKLGRFLALASTKGRSMPMVDAYLGAAVELGIISKEDPQHGDRPGSAAYT